MLLLAHSLDLECLQVGLQNVENGHTEFSSVFRSFVSEFVRRFSWQFWKLTVDFVYSKTHFLWRFLIGWGLNTARTASSKTWKIFFVKTGDGECNIEHLFKASLSESGALEVLDSSNFVGQLLSLLPLDWRVTIVWQSLQSLLVLPQVNFGSWQNI